MSDQGQSGAPQAAIQQGEWIEEGLFFQGEAPPQSDEWAPGDWVEIPHEHYIPISKARFVRAMMEHPTLRENEEGFTHLMELSEGLYHFFYHRLLNELKEDYEYFAPDTGEKLREGVSEEELLWRERRFLTNFLKTMFRGNFNPMTEENYTRACEHSYLFDLPVDINWNVFDPRMLQEYFGHLKTNEGQKLEAKLELDESIEEVLSLPKEFDTNILVFHRGIERDKTEGMFLMQKIDFLLSRVLGVVLTPIQVLIEKARGDKKSENVLLSLFTDDKSKPETVKGNDEERTTVFERRWVRRQNIASQPKEATKLLRPIKLQEPAMQRVISLFRLRPPTPPSWMEKLPVVGKIISAKKPPEGARDWTINLKMFKNIPMADTEIIFPEKNMRMKSFDVTMLVLTVLLGFFALYKSLKTGGGSAIVIVLSVLVAYSVKLVLGYRRTKANYMAKITQDLYHKNLDNNIGVLQYLMDTLEEQEFKEAILCYYILLIEGTPLTADEIDERAEMFLKDKFEGLEVDFEVDDALDKVIEKDEQGEHDLPIVKVIQSPDGEERYEAKPLGEALHILDNIWDNLYQYNED
ncbi:MAG: DUF3754 domain-containing protein [Myxococcales bacterium]|nr:DUF3754 domain-containing protein [Myxococcales bacterium]